MSYFIEPTIPLSNQLAKCRIATELVNNWQLELNSIAILEAGAFITSFQASRFRRKVCRNIRNEIRGKDALPN